MSKPRAPLLQGRRILVAEDEYLIGCDLADALQRFGADVLGPFSTLHAALRIAESSASIDGAVLDLNLGGEMVWPVVERLLSRDVPIVLATSYGTAWVPERYGAIPCFSKPILVRLVARSLAERLSVHMAT